MPRRSARSLFATLAKSAFAVGVFSATVAAWSLVGPHVVAHRALPDGGVEGRCAIWFVGSSSIHRWTTMASDMAPWEVHNRGVNGALMTELTARFLNERAVAKPAAVVFYLGENDINAGAGPEAVEGAAAHLVRTTRQRMPGTKVFVVGLKPSPRRWAQRPEQLRFNRAAATWAREDRHVTFLDVADTLLVRGVPGPFFLDDGIHLDDAGDRRWSRRVRAGIEAAMPPATVRPCTARRPAAA